MLPQVLPNQMTRPPLDVNLPALKRSENLRFFPDLLLSSFFCYHFVYQKDKGKMGRGHGF
jgi:hypothetical protein